MSNPQPPDFRELTARLMAYGIAVFAELGIFGEHTVVEGVGVSLEDLVSKVLLEYVTGKIKHHPSRGSLISLLGKALKNDLLDALDKSSHEKEEARSIIPIPTDEPKRGSDVSLDEFEHPEVHLESLLDEERYRQRVKSALADEPDLLEFAEAVLDLGLEKPQELADFFDITPEEIHNRKKRLRRRLVEHRLVSVKKR